MGKLTGEPGICFVTRGPGGDKRRRWCSHGNAGLAADVAVHWAGRQ